MKQGVQTLSANFYVQALCRSRRIRAVWGFVSNLRAKLSLGICLVHDSARDSLELLHLCTAFGDTGDQVVFPCASSAARFKQKWSHRIFNQCICFSLDGNTTPTFKQCRISGS